MVVWPRRMIRLGAEVQWRGVLGTVRPSVQRSMRSSTSDDNSTKLSPSSSDSTIKDISIDRSKLRHSQFPAAPLLQRDGGNSQMLAHLRQRIRLRNPLTIADYMRECLTNPNYGYYMKKDVFGVKGDFTTAPEISQVFGECIGVWIVNTLGSMIKNARPSGFRLVELGPGRGTLMKDITRAIAKVAPAVANVLEVDLVEVSPHLRSVQEKTLSPQADYGIKFRWHKQLDEVETPEGTAVIYLAQEFFDALAVHQFVRTKERGWCERLVDVDDRKDAEFPLRYVLSPGATATSRAYAELFPKDEAVTEVEICPEGVGIAEKIGHRIANSKGQEAALVIDYGRVGPIAASVRGIRRHAIEPVLANPGEADLSADVDFGMLAAAAQRSADGKVRTYGPMTQRDFLQHLGAEVRFGALLKAALTARDPRQGSRRQKDLIEGYQRLIGDGSEDMGEIYKAMVIANVDLPAPHPFQLSRNRDT